MNALDTWTRGTHTYDGTTHPTWRKGTGAGVVVVHEIPGITDAVVAFAEEVVAAGHTVVMPQLFGEVGGPMTPVAVAKVVPRVCISKEFTAMARNRTTPLAGWLRSLARDLHGHLGGP
jgi:dienelactone hydrolase